MSLPQRIIDDTLQRYRSTALTPRKQRHAAKPEVTTPAESGRAPLVRVADLVPPAKPRPDHYKVICISIYNEDLARLDELVLELKRRGFTKANRSALLRAAVEQFDPSKVTRGL